MKLWVKISLLITVLASLIGIGLSITYKFQSENALWHSHDHWSSALTQALSSAILKDTIKNKQRNVKEVLKRVQKDNPSISYLVVTDFHGNMLASTIDNPPASIYTGKTQSRGIRQLRVNGEIVTNISQPLVKNLDALLHIGVNQHNLNRSLDETKYKIIFTTTLLTLIATIIGIGFSRQISRPIEKLSESIIAFGKGQKHSPIDISGANSEVQRLYQSFEKMADQRKSYENELEFYRNELEQLVLQRTKQLEDEIEKHKQTEKHLRQAKEEADQANSAKSAFLSQMSHEFRTPLNAILGFAQLIEMDEDLNSDSIDNLKIIKESGEHLLLLINEILDIAKIEAGKMEVSMEPVSWPETIDTCISLVETSAEKNNITINFHSQVDKNLWVEADSVRLKQITLNLLSNAVKYNKSKGSIDISLTESADNMLTFSVKDTGLGIPKQYQDNLFEPFNRLGSNNASIEGTGIGLLITKRLTEVMHGKIGFQSQENIGSTFWIKLPISTKSAEITSALDNMQKIESENQTTATITILHIEDNPVNIKLMENILRKVKEYKVISCETPEKGIEMAKIANPNIVLLDINLPGMSGYDVIKILRKMPFLRETPILAISANAMQKDIDKALNAGFTDYITKPIRVNEIFKTLDKYVDSS